MENSSSSKAFYSFLSGEKTIRKKGKGKMASGEVETSVPAFGHELLKLTMAVRSI